MDEPKRGVFWLVEDELLIVPFEEGTELGLSKSGNNYNHRLLWEHVKPPKCNKTFDYYPRGRVEYNGKGKPVIYLNRNIDESHIQEIVERFGITETPRIHYDGSDHYKSHFDRP